jgi:hypothetical protein
VSICRVAGSRRHTTPDDRSVRPSRRRGAVAAFTLVGFLLGATGTADASLYLSHARAVSIVRGLVRANAVAHVDNIGASCYPTGRRHTRRNLLSRWDSWDCTYTVHLSHADGSTGRCTGAIRIVGRRHGYAHHAIRPGHCVQLTGATPAPTPTPTPAPSPTPTPTPGTSRQQAMLNEEARFGIERANELIAGSPTYPTAGSGAFYYGQMELRQCTYSKPTVVSCPLYMWREGWDQGPDTALYPTREIYRAFVTVEDLGTAAGFNDAMWPDSAIDISIRGAYWRLCSNYWADLPDCPSNRFPIPYPPYPNFPRPVGT